MSFGQSFHVLAGMTELEAALQTSPYTFGMQGQAGNHFLEVVSLVFC